MLISSGKVGRRVFKNRRRVEKGIPILGTEAMVWGRERIATASCLGIISKSKSLSRK